MDSLHVSRHVLGDELLALRKLLAQRPEIDRRSPIPEGSAIS